MTASVDEAMDEIWQQFGRTEGLLKDLAADATWARATGGELRDCLPRLLELWVAGDLAAAVEPHLVMDEISAARDGLTTGQARSIEALADARWMLALTTTETDANVEQLLGELVHLDLRMVRWLEPWLNHLDGPGARHLAEVILRPAGTPGWIDRQDEWQQVRSWAASESVVMGLTLVGGVHLNPGDLSQLLDQLI